MKLIDKYTIDYIESNGLVLLKTLVGSYSQNLQTEKSDKDYQGVFFIESDDYNSLEYKQNPFDTVSSISKENDITYIEIGKFIELLYKNNPNAIELLASSKIDGNWVIKSGFIDKLNMDLIVSKRCRDTFAKYAESQIRKATGLNKKINNPIPVKKKTPIDFCTFFNDEKTMPLKKMLSDNGLDQLFVGLSKVKNSNSIFRLYYDKYSEIKFSNIDDVMKTAKLNDMFGSFINYVKPAGFKGIEKVDGSSNAIRVSSIPKYKHNGIIMYGFITYNQDGYETYLKDYASYQHWVKNRNEERYKNNVGQKYDVKNLAHCARLLTMSKEIAEGKGVILKRTDDRDFFLNIKLGKVDYVDILEYTNNIINNLGDLFSNSTIRDTPDYEHLNNTLIKIRK